MIKKEMMSIVQRNHLAKDTFEFVLKNEYISRQAKPGQFIHIYVDGLTLRRPISIADARPEDSTITVLFKVVGEGTEDLSKLQVGNTIDVLGPSGNGFSIDTNKSETVLLVGGGIGVPPMHLLGKKMVEMGKRVISILGYQNAGYVFYEEEFKALGDTYIITDDGSYGHHGLVTDILSEIDDFDTYYACGPLPMLKAIKKELNDTPGYISLEERMGCGVGACFACVIPTADGQSYRKICQDGPVFQAKEVKL